MSRLLFLSLFVALNPVTTLHGETFEVGVAEVDITPPVGMRLCGSFNERIATGTHDPLKIRAFVFRQGSERAVLAGCDLAMLYPPVGNKVRDALASDGFTPESVILHASETHNGPDYFGEFRKVFHDRAVAELGYDPTEPINYEAFLVEQFIKAIRNAAASLKPVTLHFDSSTVAGLTFNRRFHMKDGTIGWNPGKLNPSIVAPAGPVDERLAVVSFRDVETKAPVAALPGFAMHLAILNDKQYSADYPFYLEQHLKEKFGGQFISHFLQSPCCELNHIDVTSEKPQKGHEWSRHVGETLAKHASEMMSSAAPALQAELRWASSHLELELQHFETSEVIRQRKRWHAPNRTDLPFLDLVHAGKVTGIYDRHDGGPVRSLIQTLQLSDDTALVAIPSEVSVEIGLAIREQSPYQNTMVIQLSNDWFGYIPTQQIFKQGHYEAVVAKVKPGGGEQLISAAVSLLNELHQAP